MEELVCPKCDYKGTPLVVQQNVSCYNCKVRLPWVEAGQYLTKLKKYKEKIRREEYNEKTKRSYRLR